MAYKGTGSVDKKHMQEIERRKARKERRAMLSERKSAAMSNSRELARLRAGYGIEEDYGYEENASGYRAPGYDMPEVDNRFATDMRKMKFCRKPIGFLMNIIFLVAIALVALSFIPGLNVAVLDQYTALYSESEAKQQQTTDDESGANEDGGENGEKENPSNADDATGGETADTGSGTEGGETADGETTEDGTTAPSATYYKFSDPVYGWIKYIAGLFEKDFSIGESPWYDGQIAKVKDAGMEDKISAILIQAFPPAIILYVIFALALTIKTFICWASGDRRIYRHTSIECLIMILLAALVLFGGYATTVGVTGKMDFGGILNYVIGGITGTGGFTAGYGMIIMLGLPLIGLILSFFLLEKKLRSREITQPVIMYEYKGQASGKRR